MRSVLASPRTALGIVACAVAATVATAFAVERRRAPPSQPSASAADALPIEVSGCAAVLRGPVCEVTDGAEIRLWLPGVTDGTVRVTAGDVEVSTTLTTWPDGRTVRAKVPAGAGRLDVRVTQGARATSATVHLAPWPAMGPAFEQSRALRRAGRFEEAAAALASVPEANAGARAAMLSALARIEYQRGRVDAAMADFREAISLHDAQGHLSEAVDDSGALTYLLLERSRIGEARDLMVRERELARDYADGQAQLTHDEGLLAWNTGDLRTSLRCAREAEAHFARLGMERGRRAAAVTIALRLQELGRYAEAIAIFRAVLDVKDAGACERADLLDDVGWGALLAIEDDPGARVDLDAREPLAQATELFRASCPDPNRLANVLENTALAELQHHRLAQARAALDEARAVEHDPPIVVVLFWHHTMGRIALAQGAPAVALASFVRETEIAAALGSINDQRLAAEGQAAALVALGRKTEALASLDAADALVDEISGAIPLGEGMDGFFATRDRAALRRVDLLVQLGHPDQAMAALRRWRARVLGGLRVAAALESLGPAERSRWEDAVGRYRALRDAMDQDTARDWELPSDRLAAARARREESARRAHAMLDDALSVLPRGAAPVPDPAPPGPAELDLAYVPGPSGWLAFARTADGVTVRRIDRIDPGAPASELARTMLGPFDAAIASARTIRFLPYGAARAVDLHALPWSGRPLLEHAVVEYALGLDDAPRAQASHGALVVADPGGDLPEARAEADAVSVALGRWSWHVDDLRGARADGEAVRDALGSVELLHYAGHATFGGVDGVDSALSLAGGSRLTPADILALPHVPAVVALFGCDTARESTTGRLDALGLTSAFLVAGAQVVVATSRVVDDALAREVAAEFYRRLTAATAPDAAGALREAVLAVRARSPASDWPAFRVLVRG